MPTYTASLIGYATGSITDPPTSSRPSSLVSNPGGWANVGAGANIAAALADESDASFAESPTSPSGAAFTVACNTRLDRTQTIVTVRLQTSAPTTVNVLIELLEIVSGSPVLRSSRTTTANSGWVNYSWTLTSTENSSIVDPTNLQGRITAGV